MPQYSRAFLENVNVLLDHEKGYVSADRARRNNDPGGETNWGISKRSYPNVDIKNLTREQAIEIYHRDFWLPLAGDDLPPKIAGIVFDMSVNSGQTAAARTLQRALEVKPDGNIGPATRAAIKRTPAKELALNFCAQRIIYMASLSNWDSNALGWTRRVLREYGRVIVE